MKRTKRAVRRASRRSSNKAILALVGALLLVGLAGIGVWALQRQQRTAHVVTSTVEAGTSPRLSDGPAASDFSLPTLDGGTFTLSKHQGEVVAIYFMASWCGTCIPEARSLAQLYEQYRDQGFTVVAINLEPERKVNELERFRQLADNAAYIWTFDTSFSVAQAFNVRSLDSTLIIDRSGRVAYQDGGPTPLKTLEAEIQKWL